MTEDEMRDVLSIASRESIENNTELISEIEYELTLRKVKPTYDLVDKILNL